MKVGDDCFQVISSGRSLNLCSLNVMNGICSDETPRCIYCTRLFLGLARLEALVGENFVANTKKKIIYSVRPKYPEIISTDSNVLNLKDYIL